MLKEGLTDLLQERMLHQFIQLQRSFPSLHGAPAGSLQHTLRSSIKGSPTANLPLASFKQYKYRENLALKVSNNSEQVLRCKISPILTLLAITKVSQHQLFTEWQKQEKKIHKLVQTSLQQLFQAYYSWHSWWARRALLMELIWFNSLCKMCICSSFFFFLIRPRRTKLDRINWMTSVVKATVFHCNSIILQANAGTESSLSLHRFPLRV